jgi:hypothetical protein
MTPASSEARGAGSLATVEKGGATFEGLRLLLCENPLPPLDEAIAAAREALPLSNYYTEPYSAPLRSLLARLHDVSERLIHINAGSELILRQLFDRYGGRVVMTSPTYALFPEVAREAIPINLDPANDLAFDLARLEVPSAATLVVIVNPNNPTGQSVDLADLPMHLTAHPDTIFIVDEAFIDLGGRSVVRFVPEHDNLIVTRTLSKAHSLAGFRVGYAICPPAIADDLNAPQRRVPARAAEPGGGHRHPRASRAHRRTARQAACLGREARRGPSRSRRADLPQRDVLLRRGLRPARRIRARRPPPGARHPHEAPRRRPAGPGVHARHHRPPRAERPGPRRPPRAARHRSVERTDRCPASPPATSAT